MVYLVLFSVVFSVVLVAAGDRSLDATPNQPTQAGAAKHAAPARASTTGTSTTVKGVKIEAGPPEIDVSSHGDTIRVCQSKNDCDNGMMTCSAQHTCLCDASQGFGRPGQGPCLNYLTDAGNCGTFGHRCANGQACTDGHCGRFSCERGQTACFDYCANLQKDDGDCGKCGHACRAGLSCVKGHCEL
jgi:hypothetical protein